MCPEHRGGVLMPWPNRIADGAYEFGGASPPAAAERAGQGQRHPRARPLGRRGRSPSTRRPRGADLRAPAADRLPVRARPRGRLPARRRRAADAVGHQRRRRHRAVRRRPAPLPDGRPPGRRVRADPAGVDVVPDERARPAGAAAGGRHGVRLPRAAPDRRHRAGPPVRRGRRRPSPDRSRHRPAACSSATGSAGCTSSPATRTRAAAPRPRGLEPTTAPPEAFNSGVDLVALEPGATHRPSFVLGRYRCVAHDQLVDVAHRLAGLAERPAARCSRRSMVSAVSPSTPRRSVWPVP